MKTFALSLVAALATALPASAGVVLDQSSLVGDGFTFPSYQYSSFAPGPASPPYGYAQSVTVGVTGQLDSISLALMNQSGGAVPLTLRIFAGVPFSIAQPTLYTGDYSAQPFSISLGVYVPWSTLPTIDLSAANLQVTAGQVLTFVLTSSTIHYDVGLLNYVNGVPYTYAGGDKYAVVNGGAVALTQPFGGDFAFRTFVDVGGAVPEPGAWLLMIAGFALTGAAMRRRQQAA